MLRLSPPNRELLLQTPHLDVWTAGAEANVATALALLGHDVAFPTVLPQNALGAAAIQSLRAHGVDCRPVLHRAGRMGPSFVTPGAGVRPTDVVSDRSCYASAVTSVVAWDCVSLHERVTRRY